MKKGIMILVSLAMVLLFSASVAMGEQGEMKGAPGLGKVEYYNDLQGVSNMMNVQVFPTCCIEIFFAR